jgi:hypothetical protein
VVDQEEERCKCALYNRAAGPNVGRAVHVAGRSWSRSGEALLVRNYFADRCGSLSSISSLDMCILGAVPGEEAVQVRNHFAARVQHIGHMVMRDWSRSGDAYP